MAGEITTEDNNLDLAGAETGFDNSQNPQNFFDDILTDPTKRLYAIGAAVVLVLILGIVFLNGNKQDENRGKLVPLVQEIDQSRAFEIVAKLKSVNIEAKVGQGERPGEYIVQVYEKAIETSYLALSRTNLLENDDYGLFDQNDWAASDYDKRIKLTRAINGDLSRIISRMAGIRSAIVRVNIPEQQIFTDLQAETTATVQIELDNSGEKLNKSQVKSMVNLLRGYVPELDEEKISIVDTDGNNYSSFKEDGEAGSDDYLDEVDRANKTITDRIQKYLDVVLGKELYEVSVSASISREKVEAKETTYKDGAVGSRQTGKEYLNSQRPGGVGPGNNNKKNYNSSTTNETMLPSFEQKEITYLPGKITQVTVALAVDTSVPQMISLDQLQNSVAAIIGPNTNGSESVMISVVSLVKETPLPAPVEEKSFMSNLTGIFNGGSLGWFGKVAIVLLIIFALLLIAIISLNFLSAAANPNYETELDENLGAEFDDVLHDTYNQEPDEYDYGESQSIHQQEELLKEMMGQSSEPGMAATAQKAPATSYSSTQSQADDSDQFENLLNNFQSVANAKPDILAKKIQVWLDDEL